MRLPTALTFAFLLPLGCGTLPSSDDEAADEGSSTGDSGTGDSSTGDSGTDSSTDESSTTGEPDEWDAFVEPVPGTRLRPMIRIAEDGTRIHVGWQDTLLDTPCAFAQTPNAGLRCVPTSESYAPWLFADANCSEPALQDSALIAEAKVVRVGGNACFDHTEYQIGEPVSEIFYSTNGQCEHFSNDPAHRVSVIPHEEFVSATVTALEGQSRIVPLLLQADDGARQIFGAWDRTHEEQVAAAPDTSEQLRWLGRWQPRVSTVYYADANCTERAALAECVPDSEQPTTAIETEDGYCGAFLGRRELFEEVEQLYRENAGVCEPVNGWSDRVRQWRVGAPLDDSAFAESSIVDGGGARLRHDIYTSPEGEPFLASGRTTDHDLGEMACRLRDPVTNSNAPSTNATFNCIPDDCPALFNRYQDSSCTQQTAGRVVFEEYCLEPALYAYSFSEGKAAAITGSVSDEGNFGLDGQGICQPLEPSPPPDGGGVPEYYFVEGPLTEVAHAVDVIE